MSSARLLREADAREMERGGTRTRRRRTRPSRRTRTAGQKQYTGSSGTERGPPRRSIAPSSPAYVARGASAKATNASAVCVPLTCVSFLSCRNAAHASSLTRRSGPERSSPRRFLLSPPFAANGAEVVPRAVGAGRVIGNRSVATRAVTPPGAPWTRRRPPPPPPPAPRPRRGAGTQCSATRAPPAPGAKQRRELRHRRVVVLAAVHARDRREAAVLFSRGGGRGGGRARRRTENSEEAPPCPAARGAPEEVAEPRDERGRRRWIRRWRRRGLGARRALCPGR